jgi:hypothetical protein
VLSFPVDNLSDAHSTGEFAVARAHSKGGLSAGLGLCWEVSAGLDPAGGRGPIQ